MLHRTFQYLILLKSKVKTLVWSENSLLLQKFKLAARIFWENAWLKVGISIRRFTSLYMYMSAIKTTIFTLTTDNSREIVLQSSQTEKIKEQDKSKATCQRNWSKKFYSFVSVLFYSILSEEFYIAQKNSSKNFTRKKFNTLFCRSMQTQSGRWNGVRWINHVFQRSFFNSVNYLLEIFRFSC